MPYHWHTQCEIIRILKGEFLITIDYKKILAKKGDILFIQAGILHGGTPNNCIYECIVFDINLLLKQNHACTKLLRAGYPGYRIWCDHRCCDSAGHYI